MKQVLLAIDGNIPTEPVFQYAVGLCRRIQAELNILQFVKPETLSRCISMTRKKAGRLGKLLEDSFAGVAFAEEGVPHLAVEFLPDVSDSLKKLIKGDSSGIPFKVAAGRGNFEKELLNYIDAHQDIVLTVFDPSTGPQSGTGASFRTMETLKKKLGIPLVVVKTSGD
nr:hypothetical protein [Desulfobacula sp.]